MGPRLRETYPLDRGSKDARSRNLGPALLPIPVLVRLLGHGNEVLDEVLDDEGAAGLVERLDRQVVVDDLVKVSPGPPVGTSSVSMGIMT